MTDSSKFATAFVAGLIGLAVFIGYMVTRPPSAEDVATLRREVETFENVGGVRPLSCLHSAGILVYHAECSGLIGDRPVRYACWLDRGCQWLPEGP